MGSDKVQTKNDKDLETDDLEIFLKEVADYSADYQLKPGEFTVNCVMNKADETVDRVKVLGDLHRRVDEGDLGEKLIKYDGSSQYVFWRKSK